MPYVSREKARLYHRRARIKRKQLSGISIEWDQFDEIKAFAREEGCTISEAFRLLIEWGLEARCP